MPIWLIVGLGGFLGSTLRYGATELLRQHVTSRASGTFLVNVVGSLLIGLLFGRLSAHDGLRWSFLAIGLFGGFTTFSAFSLDTLKFIQRGQWLWAGGNILLQVALGVLAVWVGYSIANSLR
ncbi:MAG: CrcB family protein [bacterium]|nr:CrcB family protein [bacterium]